MDKDEKKDEDAGDPQDEKEEFNPDSCDGNYEGCCSKQGEGKRFVWRIKDLVEENRIRKKNKLDEIPIIRRIDGYDYRYGVRAHPNMDSAKSFWSILVQWHGEFIAILIY